MTDKLYYSKDLKELANSVKSCDLDLLTEKLNYFIAQADTQMSGISNDVRIDIAYYTRKFRERCICSHLQDKRTN